jgi:hypothetical protein
LYLFLHKTCSLTEFIGCIRKLISPLYELFLLKFGRLIGIWVRNIKKLSLHQMDFFNSRYLSRNGRKSKLTKCETCLWRLKFPSSFFFIFLPYMYRKVWMLTFYCHWNHFISTFTTQVLHKTSIRCQICQCLTQVGTWSEFYL